MGQSINATQPYHGGDLETASRCYGIARNQWLDLSTGINPQSYPVEQVDPVTWKHLPDSQMIKDLESAAQTAYGAPGRADVLAAAGSAAIIHRLPSLVSKSRVHITGPTFAEHEAAWRLAGHDVRIVAGLDLDDASVMVVVNPNNPGGQRYAPEQLLSLSRKCASRGGFMVVDEAFADPCPELSVSGEAGEDGLVILKSFGKFFGLAGLRLGFAIGPSQVIRTLRQMTGPWPVSGPAVQIGVTALQDYDWIMSTRRSLRRRAARMRNLLEGNGLSIAGQTALFTLLELPDAGILHRKLARKGIWTRVFPEQKCWLRMGSPGAEPDWQRLETALLSKE